MNRDWNYDVSFMIIGDHDKLLTVAPNNRTTSCYRIDISLPGVSQNILNCRKVESAESSSVLHVIRPPDLHSVHPTSTSAITAPHNKSVNP